MRIKPIKEFRRMLTPPPDKSVTIRGIVLGTLAKGTTTIINPLVSGDTISAINAAVSLGADVNMSSGSLVIRGGELHGGKVDAGNSATTLRLFMGAVAGRSGRYEFIGDKSLSSRSMAAVISALRQMGSKIDDKGGRLPIIIDGTFLHGIDFVPSSPSAQVKSAVLLAGLSADGETSVTEQIKTRTHTEDMLPLFGADIRCENGKITVRKSELSSATLHVFGDISSAAYPIVLALRKGYCYLRGVSNARRELIDFLVSIGGDITEENFGDHLDLTVKQSELKPFCIGGELATALIDELPLLATLACTLDGKSVIKDAVSLRNKECDRISCTVKNLRALGGKIDEQKDGFIIYGGGLKGGNAMAFGDHRMAMSMAVANALSSGGGTIDDDKCVEISYPSFWELFV